MASNENIYSSIQNLYNMDKNTWQEVLAELYNLIYDTQSKFEQVETKFTSLLGEEVTFQIKEMFNDGSLGELINDVLLSDINTNVENFKVEVNDKVDNFKLEVNEQLDSMKYYATPEMFGAKGDGVTDDSVILQNIIDNTDILIGNPNKTYKGNIRIKKSYKTIENLNLKGSITFDSGIKFAKIQHCNINAEGNDYGIYAETNVTKLYIDDCYISNANICGLYLNDCWDSVLTKLSLSSNKKGFYAYQFNNGTFQGTAYGNEIGIELAGSYSCTVTGTIQENKLNGAIINSVHASEFRLYLEQNGYQGSDYQTQSQCLIGKNGARCIGTKFILYGMGGSGSDMESNYGATIMSAINCEINGYFTRHLESGLRITSGCIDCIANVTDLKHTDYGYDKSLVNRLVTLSSYIKSNTIFQISEKTPILYNIISKNSDVYKSSFEQLTNNTAIIRVEDSSGNKPTDINIRCYYTYNGIKTSID